VRMVLAMLVATLKQRNERKEGKRPHRSRQGKKETRRLEPATTLEKYCGYGRRCCGRHDGGRAEPILPSASCHDHELAGHDAEKNEHSH